VIWIQVHITLKQQVEPVDKGIRPYVDESTKRFSDKSPKKQVAKTLLTVYLDAETEQIFNRMYADKIVSGEKVDKSAIVCEAIRSLHKN